MLSIEAFFVASVLTKIIKAGPLPALDNGGCIVTAGETSIAGAAGSDSDLSVSLVFDMTDIDLGGQEETMVGGEQFPSTRMTSVSAVHRRSFLKLA